MSIGAVFGKTFSVAQAKSRPAAWRARKRKQEDA